MKNITVGSIQYTIKPSTVKNKKYDVFAQGKKVTSFGDDRYQQYKDKVGTYRHLDHHDPTRRASWLSRHANDIGIRNKDPRYASYWAKRLLW